MIRRILYLLLIAHLFVVFSCTETVEEKKKRDWDIQFLPLVARSYLEEDKLKDAEEAYKALVELTPDDATNHANLTLVYLKQNKFKEAKSQIKNALRLAPENLDIRMINAKYFDLTDQPEKAIEELEKILEHDPGFTAAIYNLAGIYKREKGLNAKTKRETYLKMVLKAAPGNIVPRLEMINLFMEKGDLSGVTTQLEELPKIFAEFPKESMDSYRTAVDAVYAGDLTSAKRSIIQLQNFLKVTGQYQSDLMALNGPEANLAGLSIVTLSDFNKTFAEPGESTIDRIRFIDITEQVDINVPDRFGQTSIRKKSTSSHFTLGDYNNDGFIDIYLNNFSSINNTSYSRLLKNILGTKFQDEAKELGITPSGLEQASIFGDYNNDGHLDLYIVKDGSNMLYKQDSKRSFSNVASAARVDDMEGGHSPLFLDADQDGDLDLFIARPSSNLLYRNNANGTFEQRAEVMGLGLPITNSSDADFADLDEDGDLDLILVSQKTSNNLLSNERHGRFQNQSLESGLSTSNASTGVCVSDYNNDGYSDLFFLGSPERSSQLYANNGNGTFSQAPTTWLKAIPNWSPKDAAFFDFDNDGFLDLIITGEPGTKKEKGLYLFHNEGEGQFTDVTKLFTSTIKAGYHIETADFDKDGDLDVFVNDQDGKLHLMQNEGGNLNHYLDIQLVGLRNGNGKNNYFGIGAKVEIRAGDLYQMHVVHEPMIHFGLGTHLKADVLRVTWPNGVAQDKFFPGSEELLLELQTLKGSCAFLYTWDGEKFVFSKDIMWRSALGMPLGIMGSNTAYAPSDASKEYLKIPGEQMTMQEGKYIIQITEELWEAAYFDNLELVAVDHPSSDQIYVDERFTLPPYSDRYKLHTVQKRVAPASTVDGNGTNVLPRILTRDHNYLSNFKLAEYQGITEMHDLIITPGNELSQGDLQLYLTGWLFPSDASINVSLGQSGKLEVVPPQLLVINAKGDWETVIPNMGFPMGKDKTMIVDLSGLYLSADCRVRIRTNMEIYWDEIFFAKKTTPLNISTTRMKPNHADLHYRGFSKLYRKGGRYGPHWFDYSKVTKGQKWRDLVGNFTRFGEVTSLLLSVDDQLVIMNSGDEMTVSFDATKLPVLPTGWKRDFLIYSEGWIKDGDLNTAHGQTVEPLPFHAMTRYPYGKNERFPSDPKHLEYRKQFNTRKVDTKTFTGSIREYQ